MIKTASLPLQNSMAFARLLEIVSGHNGRKDRFSVVMEPLARPWLDDVRLSATG
ncbi:hypothetical protein [Bradyrhizobium iriomotense]|uniref:hypothetical protein n=1 Tax=Bradyrhizobium iriomotense TaxID=441950 RepID=UPI0024E0ED5F|nr:hypothetical protein [Bradyrhizobium iriomotense]